MSLKLYFASGACSFIPHVLLEATGQPFEPAPIRLHKGEHLSPEFKAINPRGQVPVLVDGDQVITQIVAIVDHIACRFPEQRFVPASGIARTRVLESLAWMNNTMHPTFTHVFMPQRFTDNEAIHEDLRRFNRERFRQQLGELEVLAGQASPFIAGADFGPLDAYALTLTRWAGLGGIDPKQFQTLWPFVQRVAGHPPVARVIERERLQLDMFKPG